MVAFLVGLVIGLVAGGAIVYIKYNKINAATSAVQNVVTEVKKSA